MKKRARKEEKITRVGVPIVAAIVPIVGVDRAVASSVDAAIGDECPDG